MTKTEIMRCRIEPEVKALARALAAERHVTMSEYIRSLIHEDAGLTRKTSTPQCPHGLPQGCCLVCERAKRARQQREERRALRRAPRHADGQLADGQLEAGYDLLAEVPRG